MEDSEEITFGSKLMHKLSIVCVKKIQNESKDELKAYWSDISRGEESGILLEPVFVPYFVT